MMLGCTVRISQVNVEITKKKNQRFKKTIDNTCERTWRWKIVGFKIEHHKNTMQRNRFKILLWGHIKNQVLIRTRQTRKQMTTTSSAFFLYQPVFKILLHTVQPFICDCQLSIQFKLYQQQSSQDFLIVEPVHVMNKSADFISQGHNHFCLCFICQLIQSVTFEQNADFFLWLFIFCNCEPCFVNHYVLESLLIKVLQAVFQMFHTTIWFFIWLESNCLWLQLKNILSFVLSFQCSQSDVSFLVLCQTFFQEFLFYLSYLKFHVKL
jgi:hypothetical protein